MGKLDNADFIPEYVAPDLPPDHEYKGWTPELRAWEQRAHKVVIEIHRERARQILEEGWTALHDDQYEDGELAEAAACYARFASRQGIVTPDQWPMAPNWWKQKGYRRDLVRAAALVMAEIERLDRVLAKRFEGSTSRPPGPEIDAEAERELHEGLKKRRKKSS
jgi:hypothetical protein